MLGAGGGVGAFLVQLSEVEGNAPFVGYALRCLQAGGALAEQFVEHVHANAVEALPLVVLSLLAIACAAVSGVGFRRRDVQG